MPVHTTNKISVQVPALPNRAPARKPDLKPIFSEFSPIKNHDWNFLSPHGQNTGRAVQITASSHPAPKHLAQDSILKPKHFGQDSTLRPKHRDNRPDERAHDLPQQASESHALGHVLHTNGPDPNSTSRPQSATHRRGQESTLSVQDPRKRSALIPVQTSQNPPKKMKHSPLETLRQSTQRPDPGAGQPPSNRTGFGLIRAPHVTRKTPTVKPRMKLQPLHSGPQPNSVQPSTTLPLPPSDHVLGQPLRIIFTRLGNGCWSSKFPTSPTCLPAEDSVPPVQNPQGLDKSERHCHHLPLSVLYEDLLVSSSEESD